MLQCCKPFVWMHKGKTTFSERSHRSVGVFFSEPLSDFPPAFQLSQRALKTRKVVVEHDFQELIDAAVLQTICLDAQRKDNVQ